MHSTPSFNARLQRQYTSKPSIANTIKTRVSPTIKCQSSQDMYKKNLDDNRVENSRRTFLTQLFSTLSTATAILSATPFPTHALPGFKKELKNKRKPVLSPDEYKNGENGLKFYDVLVGTGPIAKQGDRVAVHVDVKWRGITMFTSRQGMGVTGGSPLGFDVGAAPGAGGTLKGVDIGVRGMHVGGQRRLLVPPELGYGKKGRGEVPPDATLEVDVALLSIKQNAFGSRVKIVEG